MEYEHNQDWTSVDVEALPSNAEPVTAYKPAGDRATYDRLYTHWGDTSARDHYRVAWRNMAAITGERTLVAALIPKGAAHVHTVSSTTSLEVPTSTVLALSSSSSLLSDFMMRASGRGHIHASDFSGLPALTEKHSLSPRILLRTLRLNCMTDAYVD